MPFKQIKSSGRVYIGLYGDTGAGKTHTAVNIAMAAKKHLKLDGPVCVVDTEKAYRYHVDRVQEAGAELLVSQTRDLDVLKSDLVEASKSGVAVFIIDSLTHFLESERDRWCERHKKQRHEMEGGDYTSSDARFKALLDKMLLSDMNLVCCAREQLVYGSYRNKSGALKQGPVGTKFGAGKAGYEFDLLLDLKKIEEKGKPTKQIAVVEKDRTRNLQGQVLTVPWSAVEKLEPYFNYQLGDADSPDPELGKPEEGA